MRRVSIAVYVMALSLMLVLIMVAYVIREDRQEQETIATELDIRSRRVNEFLRTEVCERLGIRDEIQLSYLRAAYDRYVDSDPPFAEVLANAIRAIEFTRSGCLREIPDTDSGG